MDNKAKSSMGSNGELMLGIILLSGASDASFLSGVLDIMNHDNYMPQAYSVIDKIKARPSNSSQQHVHPYTGHLMHDHHKQSYVAERVGASKLSNAHNENE